MSGSQETGLTIGQIGERVRRLARDPGRVSEHLRHAAKRGYLSPLIIRAGEGPGKHTLYHPDAIYEASVLAALGALDLHPGHALWLDDLVAMCAQLVPKWKAARRKGQTPQFYIISGFDPRRGETATKFREERPAEESPVTVTVDLSLLWRMVEQP